MYAIVSFFLFSFGLRFGNSQVAIPIKLSDRDQLLKSAVTALNSKVVSQHSASLGPIIVDAMLRVLPSLDATTVDLRDIRIIKKLE